MTQQSGAVGSRLFAGALMPPPRMDIRMIKDVLRLKLHGGLSHEAIGRILRKTAEIGAGVPESKPHAPRRAHLTELSSISQTVDQRRSSLCVHVGSMQAKPQRADRAAAAAWRAQRGEWQHRLQPQNGSDQPEGVLTMNRRTLSVLVLTLGTGLIGTQANATQPLHAVPNEAGYEAHPADGKAGLSRAQKAQQDMQTQRELEKMGWRYAGNAGWIKEGHRVALRGGRLVHTDDMDHNSPKPSTNLTDEERQMFKRLYSGG